LEIKFEYLHTKKKLELFEIDRQFNIVIRFHIQGKLGTFYITFWGFCCTV